MQTPDTLRRMPARPALTSQGIANVHPLVGDSSLGLPEHAPFEAILLSAAFPEVPSPLIDQLAPGRRLAQPIGPGGCKEVVLFQKDEQGLIRERCVTGPRFVRLYGRRGYPWMKGARRTDASPQDRPRR
jgi:protein-L-isoaspartate(D-aspartate) O-methyltransferase